ncbi:MAG TPA: hypothetical protein VE821_11945, partial [Pyrinomonadaceae bacterium]|nr:hypothetical protein [Pyrinomonadaceae bacterium]
MKRESSFPKQRYDLFVCRAGAVLLALCTFVAPLAYAQQQPNATPPPPRTGRSYSTGAPDAKLPPPPPQAPAPVTFTDIT